MSDLGLSGKNVLVTGSSRGIGLAVARAFAGAGAHLHLLADDRAVVAEAEALAGVGHVADITDAAAVERAVTAAGTIDVLVNNAGLERITPLDDASAETEAVFRRVVEINIVGTYLVTRAAVPRMRSGAAIINTASLWSRGSEAGFSAYVASKHATIGLTKTWAKELGPRGIRVNAVCPGWVRRCCRSGAYRNGRGEARPNCCARSPAPRSCRASWSPVISPASTCFWLRASPPTSPASRWASIAANCRGD